MFSSMLKNNPTLQNLDKVRVKFDTSTEDLIGT
jgi:Rieske Fe-S protein